MKGGDHSGPRRFGIYVTYPHMSTGNILPKKGSGPGFAPALLRIALRSALMTHPAKMSVLTAGMLVLPRGTVGRVRCRSREPRLAPKIA
jgi:hypothetical protein